MLESGQTSRFHGGRLLGGIKLGWHGDNDAAAVVYPCISGKSLNDLSRELLRGEVLPEVLAAVGFDGAHRALELLEDICRCRATVSRLGGTEHLVGQFVSSSVASVDNALTGDGHDGRDGVLLRVALLDDRHAVLHHGNGGVGRAEVDTSVDFPVVVHK